MTSATYLPNFLQTFRDRKIPYLSFSLLYRSTFTLLVLLMLMFSPALRQLFLFLSLPQDFVISLSIILRGSTIDKLNWAFNLYDLNKDGCITREVPVPSLVSVNTLMLSAHDSTFPFFSLSCAGDDRHHELHLWHDGELYVPQHEGLRPQGSCGHFLPGKTHRVYIEKYIKYISI